MGDKIVVTNVTILFSFSSSSFSSDLLGRDEVVEVGIFFFFLFLVSSRRSLRGDF